MVVVRRSHSLVRHHLVNEAVVEYLKSWWLSFPPPHPSLPGDPRRSALCAGLDQRRAASVPLYYSASLNLAAEWGREGGMGKEYLNFAYLSCYHYHFESPSVCIVRVAWPLVMHARFKRDCVMFQEITKQLQLFMTRRLRCIKYDALISFIETCEEEYRINRHSPNFSTTQNQQSNLGLTASHVTFSWWCTVDWTEI